MYLSHSNFLSVVHTRTLPFCLIELLLVEEALQEEVKIQEMIDSLESKAEELLPLKEEQNDYKRQLKEFQDDGYVFTQTFSPPC